MQGEDNAATKEITDEQLIRAVQYGDFTFVETAIGVIIVV